MNPLVLALISAAMWGATDLVTSYVGRRIGSLRVVVIAVSTSLVLAGAVAIARGALTTNYDPTIVGGTLLLGVAAGVAYIGVFTAFRLGPLSVVSPTISAYGALLIIDETHTISVGPGGMTLDLGLKPDFLTIGKAIAGGIPVGTFGMTDDVANSIKKLVELEIIDTGGIGSTLAGNAMSLAAMRATLSEVLTADAFKEMIALGDRWSDGVDAAIAEFDLDWHCNRLGARGEYIFKGKAPRTGRDAAESGDFELEQYIHLRLLNDGFLLTPFHNMALMSPDTTAADVDKHTKAFRKMCAELVKA